MTLTWTWTFIIAGIGYGVFLGLGCGGLVAYNIWNKKDVWKTRQRQDYELYRSERAAMSTDTVHKITNITGPTRWRESSATIKSIKGTGKTESQLNSDYPQRLSNLSLGRLSLNLNRMSMASATSLERGLDSRRNSEHSLDGISVISSDDESNGHRTNPKSSHRPVSPLSCIGDSGLDGDARVIVSGAWEDILDVSKHHRDGPRVSMQTRSRMTENDLKIGPGDEGNTGRRSPTVAQSSEPSAALGSSTKPEHRRRSSIYSQLSKTSFEL